MIAKLKQIIERFVKHALFLSFYLPSLLFAIAWGVRMPVLPLYASELSEGYGLVGFVVAAAGLGTLFADLPIGRQISGINTRKAMIFGVGIDALSTLLLVWVDSIWIVIFLRLISGVGHAVFSIARHTYITNAVRVTARGQAISLFGGMLRVGLFIGPAIGGILAARFGLRLPFAAFALICLIAILVMVLAKNHFTMLEKLPQIVGDEPAKLRSILKGRSRIFISASFAHFLAQITRAGESLLLPLWGADILMLPPDQIGWVVSLTSAVSMTLFYPVGLIMDRLGRKFAIIPSFVVMGVGLALLPLTRGFGGLLLVAALIGLGHGLGSGTMMVLGSDLSPEKGRSAYLGAWRWIGDAGNSGGPLIVGFVAQALALPLASLSIAFAGLLAGGVFAFLVPETLKKERRLVEE